MATALFQSYWRWRFEFAFEVEQAAYRQLVAVFNDRTVGASLRHVTVRLADYSLPESERALRRTR